MPVYRHGFEPIWGLPPSRLVLARDGVHLWRGRLDLPAGEIEQTARVLSEDERGRAGRISNEPARARFVAGRCILRSLLGRYLGLPAEQLEFAYSPRGKPELASPTEHRPLSFSLAHSGDWILIAVASGRAVGVDIEFVRPLFDIEGLVGRIFSADEQAQWHALPPDKRLEGFFRAWTGKEAWLKAKSMGLTWPPDWFSVSLTPGTPLRLLSVRDEPGAQHRWSLVSFDAAPDYLAALAAEGSSWRAICYDWSLQAG
jgi:4'-phosphopantetheinyl transferase